MNTNIKFKAICDDKSIFGNSIDSDSYDNIYEFFKDIYEYSKQYNCKFKLLQYIGLDDKYNNGIYDGDIVKDEYGKVISIITFFKGSFCLFNVLEYGFYPIINLYVENIKLLTLNDIKDYEVIGNIFDNKDEFRRLYEKAIYSDLPVEILEHWEMLNNNINKTKEK
jgi:hypothetical protein